MEAYDLDGTLADVNFSNAQVRGMARVFAQAGVIYRPENPFIVITARPHDTVAERQATRDWLETKQPNFKAIHYVTGTEAEIVDAKARLLRSENVTDFTDNNETILAALKEKNTGVRLWRMTSNGRRRYA